MEILFVCKLKKHIRHTRITAMLPGKSFIHHMGRERQLWAVKNIPSKRVQFI